MRQPRNGDTRHFHCHPGRAAGAIRDLPNILRAGSRLSPATAGSAGMTAEDARTPQACECAHTPHADPCGKE
jgi:hypothetical protein